MRSSSFVGGLILGAVAAVWLSKRKTPLFSTAGTLGLSGLTKQNGESSSVGAAASSYGSQAGQVSPSQTTSSGTVHSKESNLNTIKDIIKGNPGLHREVEQILKETNTVIPGL
ncbi:hypothetical protein [Paenibacillus tuaregi]|uniref:hypothetical protein n=1 Tax=Paenibacillus tuaregi TaxID=1816681 RepID=UPI000839046C|nr:hypothetical protein [Paenibacillus tuaregi]